MSNCETTRVTIGAWLDGELVGGLYGVALGRAFFGESMFSIERDASKVALKRLCDELIARGVHMIDCQMATSHLATFGARMMPRARFVAGLAELVECGPVGGKAGPWRFDDDLFD